MADMFGGGNNGPLTATGMDIQTATNVLPIPICWGTNALAANLTWADGFKYNPNGSGKGFGGKGGQANYSASIMMSVCRGITSGMPLVFEGTQTQNNQSEGGEGWFASNSITFVNGSQPDQTAWSGFGSGNPFGNFQYADLNYPSISALFAPNYNLGGSPEPPNFRFVLQCDPAKFAPYSLVPIGIVQQVGDVEVYVACDGDPALIIDDMINGPTNTGRGFQGLVLDATTCLTADALNPTADSTFQTWCYANSISHSPFLRSVQKAGQTLDDWAQLLNFEIGFFDGMLKILPRGDTVQTGNGRTFTPNLTPVVQLTADDFITDDKSMPIKISRAAPEDIPNLVRLETTECRYIGYSPYPVSARNEVDFQLAGNVLRIMPMVEAHSIISQSVGATLANLLLQKLQALRNTYVFTVGPALGTLLTPMDLVGLTDAATGLFQYVVRINKDGMASDEKGNVTITCEDFLQGSSTVAQLAGPAPGTNPVNTNIIPDPVNTPVIFEAPAALATPAQLWFGLSGGLDEEADPNWGGCEIWGSVGGGSYALLGQTSAGPAAQGLLTAGLAAYAGANPDTTNTLSVDLNQSGRQLTSFPGASAAAGASLCYVDGELLAYTTATLTSITIQVSELQSVAAAPGPYIITANLADNFVAGVNVTFADGTPMFEVTGPPGNGQYNVAAGVYTFNAEYASNIIRLTYTATAPGYNLTGLYRGLYGTTPGAHSAAAQFCFLGDSAPVKLDIPAGYIGQTASFKFPSTNIFKTGAQPISTLPAYTYAIAGTGFGTGAGGVPAEPTGLAVTGGNQSAVVVWNANSGNDNVTSYQIYRAAGASAAFSAASLVWQGNALTYIDQNLSTNAAYTWFVIAVNAIGVSTPSTGASATTGAGATPATGLLTATVALAAGDFVNVFPSGGNACVRLADNTGGGIAASGYVLAAAAIGAPVTVYFQGVNTALTGLTPGDPYWLGTAGAATNTPPGLGNFLQPLGQALSATQLTFQLQTGTQL